MIPLLAASIISLSGTTVSLQPSTDPGALAEVAMQNELVNSTIDEGTYPLELDGLSVTVTFEWDADSSGGDKITVTPPDGVICKPATCELTLPENTDGVIYLFEWVGY